MACSLRNNVFEITARTIHAWNNKLYKIYAGCVKLCPQ